jgi:SAM-dependent methyltransferase
MGCVARQAMQILEQDGPDSTVRTQNGHVCVKCCQRDPEISWIVGDAMWAHSQDGKRARYPADCRAARSRVALIAGTGRVAEVTTPRIATGKRLAQLGMEGGEMAHEHTVASSEWREANRANWDERVRVHLEAPGYDLSLLRGGHGRLNGIEEAELPPMQGLRVLHLQCHFGRDSLTLAQRGAEVVGLDFSHAAIEAAQKLAAELGLAGRARFVEADLYDAPEAIREPAEFDLVYVTWGAITWLPDIARWAQVVANFLKPGGSLYLAEGHPAALVFDDTTRMPNGLPGYFAPYFGRDALVVDDPRDYADPSARLTNARQYNWIHPLGDVVAGLNAVGMRLQWLHEHDGVPWQMFECLVKDASGLYRWPDQPWLPLAFSLSARRTEL